jgi:DtxR family Mn-dependent transcriptional regulator
MGHRLRDEILECLWALREKGSRSYNDVIQTLKDQDAAEVMKKMEKNGYIVIEGEEVRLTEKGEARARDLTRRHRLAERLFHDVLDLSMEESESTACEMEHFLSPAVTDSVCAFLGHPPTCPHGKPIPRGECCSKYSKEFRPLIIKLRDLEVGSSGRIVFIRPSESTRIERLSIMGIAPGVIVKLKQKRPSIILQVDETTLAVDSLIAEEIYVKPI